MRLTLGLALALALSLLANGILGWRLAGASPRCELKQAAETRKANTQLRQMESARDKALDGVATDTKAKTRKAVGKVEQATDERAEAIDRARTDGGCRAPVGLPSLDAAVDQANTAAGD